ncbi:MAG TPA: cyclodeaminase/cyclohydrolase family protein [Chloroflexi bacterium]|nr:cyclodeaminase/cyclohydrolase family protein [Chloroflexota bacterium]
MMAFTELAVQEFLDALASSEPVPGGGSTAALGGSLAAGLVSMVCYLTAGKKGYEDAWDAMAAVLEESEKLRHRLAALLEEDTRAYGRVMEAYRLPRKTDEQKKARTRAIQAALKEAAEVPLTIAESCGRVLELALPTAEQGNRWAISDAGAGAYLAEACMRAALLNIDVNLNSIRDEEYIRVTRARIEALTQGKAELRDRVVAVVRAQMSA